MTVDYAIIQTIIRDAVSACCDSQIPFTNQIKIEGTIGIIVDGSQVALVHLRDALLKEAPVVTNSCTLCGVDADDVIETKSHISTKNVAPSPKRKCTGKAKRNRISRAAARQPKTVPVFPVAVSVNSSSGQVVVLAAENNIVQNDLASDMKCNAVDVKTEDESNFEEPTQENDGFYYNENNEETDQSGDDFTPNDENATNEKEIYSLHGEAPPEEDLTPRDESDPTTLECITRAESFIKEMGHFACSGCSKTFKNFRNLKEHFLVHHRGYRLKCKHCGKELRSRDALRLHMNFVHVANFKYRCQICNKGLYDKPSLVAHLDKHTGQRRYQCERCQKVFLRESYLKVHWKLCGTTEKAFVCELCGEGFKIKRYLHVHQKKHGIHSKKGDFQCMICCELFQERSALINHSHTAHIDPE